MRKKYLFFIFSVLILLILFTNGAKADSNKIWLIKSKTTPVYTLWLDGTITLGAPEAITETITLEAKQHTSANPQHWFSHGNALYTPWARKPIIYSFESKEGSCRIGLSVKNYASRDPSWTKPSGFNYFNVDVFVDNRRKGTMRIEASDIEIKTGYLNIDEIDSGEHQVKFIWTNDRYNPKARQDANIEIHNIAIEQIY